MHTSASVAVGLCESFMGLRFGFSTRYEVLVHSSASSAVGLCESVMGLRIGFLTRYEVLVPTSAYVVADDTATTGPARKGVWVHASCVDCI